MFRVFVWLLEVVWFVVAFVRFPADEYFRYGSDIVQLGLCVFRCEFDFAQWRYRSQ